MSMSFLGDAYRLALLTTRWRAFPDENPNLVIECDVNGRVRYANPEALRRFPDIPNRSWRHPLLAGIPQFRDRIVSGGHISREVDLGDSVFEQKICFSGEGAVPVFRVYAHDVTVLRRAEEAIENLAARLVAAQEEERHRISRELHDEAGQALTALKISMELLCDDAAAAAPDMVPSLREAVSVIEITRRQLRIIAHDLRPPALDLGIDDALRGFCIDFAERTELNISYTGSEQTILTEALETTIYRFLQEALTNVAAHANASNVEVVFTMEEHAARLDVMDDGVGFNPANGASSSSAGIGLTTMRERIELLGGTLLITSDHGMGARLSARLPTH